MDRGHIARIAELERQCFNAPWSEECLASELDNELAYWIVAMEGDAVAGYVGSQTVLGETDMMNIAVHPDHRRKGIAERLLLELIAALKGMDSHCLTLEVRESNEPARRLYEKHGFQEIGRRKNYYRDPKEDALILRKEF